MAHRCDPTNVTLADAKGLGMWDQHEDMARGPRPRYFVGDLLSMTGG